jgi:crossover junction endodeoxyribonuclease RuvC
MEMRIWSFDLGTNTGYAIGGFGSDISGTANLQPSRFDSGGMRFIKFRQHLNDLLKSGKPDRVVYEEVRRHVGTTAAHVYGGLLAILQQWCIDNGVEYEGIPVGTIKKYATGKGNGGKMEVMDAVRAWGYNPKTSDQADAIALLKYVLARGV